ncbi:MAG: VCBS repeat-containing protein [Candidatus Zixiibacteriota bacterium]|nr:MAG: VCBS repeat-containing protein [candidate division Zixibacteria bacterium]
MLHYAAARGHEEQVKKMLNKGADVNARCINGGTPLYYASLWKHEAVVEYLKAHGADETAGRINQFEGDYLGRKIPGRVPEVFAENAFLTPFAPHGSIAISPDGQELFWCHHAMPIQAMWYMKQENGTWSLPKIAPFTNPDTDYHDGSPSFSHDGKRLFFHSHRPLIEGGERKEDSDIWFVEKQGSQWSTPIHLDSPVNTDKLELAPTVGRSENLYFIGSEYENSLGTGDIYVSEFINGRYTPPKNLGSAVNSEYHELSPAIAPDESYLIFASDRPIFYNSSLNLYASFRRDDGSWTEAVDLGRAISENGWHPFISFDGEYVFYLRNDQYYWFSAQVIEELKEAMIGTKPRIGQSAVKLSFRKSDQYFEPARTSNIKLGDLDGDGDPDAVFSNMAFNHSRVLLNDGKGHFTFTRQSLTQQGHGVDLGDLDGDGDLDIFLTCAGYGENNIWYHRPSKIYLNDGKAGFHDSGQDLGDSLLSGNAATLHDLDGDGDLDALVYYYPDSNLIYLNDGNGNFTASNIAFSGGCSWIDLDSDGDIDYLVREIGTGFRTMLNDGKMNFTEHWHLADSTTIRGRIGFGDLDGDGDPDAIVTSGGNLDSRHSVVWFNDGTGRFEDGGMRLPVTRWSRLDTGDINNDGYLDVFVSNHGLPNYVWLNDGAGGLYDSGLRLGGPALNASCSLADLDGDGDLDVFVAAFAEGSNEIWFNEL